MYYIFNAYLQISWRCFSCTLYVLLECLFIKGILEELRESRNFCNNIEIVSKTSGLLATAKLY